MKIYLESGNFGWDYVIVNDEDNRTLYLQMDVDYPGVASLFGWVGDHGENGGYGDIAGAQEFLDSIADTATCVDDPGYFDADNG